MEVFRAHYISLIYVNMANSVQCMKPLNLLVFLIKINSPIFCSKALCQSGVIPPSLIAAVLVVHIKAASTLPEWWLGRPNSNRWGYMEDKVRPYSAISWCWWVSCGHSYNRKLVAAEDAVVWLIWKYFLALYVTFLFPFLSFPLRLLSLPPHTHGCIQW